MTKNGEDGGKLIVVKGFKKLPKVENIAQSGHTDGQREGVRHKDGQTGAVNDWEGVCVSQQQERSFSHSFIEFFLLLFLPSLFRSWSLFLLMLTRRLAKKNLFLFFALLALVIVVGRANSLTHND